MKGTLAAQLAALDGFANADRYRAFVQAVATETAQIISDDLRLKPEERDQLAEEYAAKVLAVLSLAARAVSGPVEMRGESAGRLFAVLALPTIRCPFASGVEYAGHLLALLPDDAPAGMLRSMLAAAHSTEGDDWPGYPRGYRGWLRRLRTHTPKVAAELAAALSTSRAS